MFAVKELGYFRALGVGRGTGCGCKFVSERESSSVEQFIQ